MAKQRYQLPKEGLTDPEDRARSIVDGDDVEGHGIPLTAPPSYIGGSRPGHGGENIPTIDDEDDIEGNGVR